MPINRNLRICAFTLLALVATACGGAAENASGGVASAADLEDAPTTTETVDNEGGAEEDAAGDADLTVEEAGLALAVCMRDNGFPDFPDPEIDGNGGLNLRAIIADSGVDFNDPDFRTQIQTCAGEVGADNLGGGGNRADIQNGVQENLLVYTQCLRDEGLDVGDIDFGGGIGGGAGGAGGGAGGAGGGGAGGGGAGGGDGANAGNGDGNGPGPQGNGGAGGGPGNRIAQFLGLDADDPATAEALAACEDVLAEAFAGIGGGGGQGGPPAQGGAADTTDT